MIFFGFNKYASGQNIVIYDSNSGGKTSSHK